MKKILALLLCLLTLHAEIIETNRMEDLLIHVDNETWVFFDIDDTLLESELQWGRAKWYFYEVQKLMDQGFDNETAQKSFYPTWILSQQICPIRTPESNISDLVQAVQEKASATMALTARHPPAADTTLKQIAFLEIDFQNTHPVCPPFETIEPVLFKGGVLFISDFNKKGHILRQLLEKTTQKPKKVILIDDGRHHLADAEKQLSEIGIPFLGLHYTKTLERPFEAETAESESLFKK